MEEKSSNFAASVVRRQAARAGVVLATLGAACNPQQQPDNLLSQSPANHVLLATGEQLGTELLTGVRELARQIAEGKKFNKLIAGHLLQKAMADYDTADERVKDNLRANGLLHVYTDKTKGKAAAVYVDFDRKAIVAAKDITPSRDAAFPIMDLSNASRGGVVTIKDRAASPQEEGSYLNMAYRLRDRNIATITEGIRQVVLTTKNMRKLSSTQLAVLDDDRATMDRFKVSPKLFPTLVPIGKDVVFRRFKGEDIKRGVMIHWNEDERVYEGQTYNRHTERWDSAGKVNPSAAAIAEKAAQAQQQR